MEQWAHSTAASSVGGPSGKGKGLNRAEKHRRTSSGSQFGGQQQLLHYTASLTLQNAKQLRELFAFAQRTGLARVILLRAF